MARKILLADDSVTAQNMGRKILADAGYEVIAVNNGSAALKKIAELKPDLVILDVYMPGYSGLEVCQRLKESQETARIPVLLSVGKLEPFKPEEAQRVRADGFIVKPFEASELLSALSKLEDKVVPRAEPSKPGRFARAIAAAEESDRGSRSQPAGDQNGWKNRIGFPHEKTGSAEKAADESSIYNPMNRDLRTVVETAGEKAAGKAASQQERRQEAAETGVDVAALAPAGLPIDVTPEEVAAIAAAAAQIQMAGAATQDEHRASEGQVTETQLTQTQVTETRVTETLTQASPETTPHEVGESLPSVPDVYGQSPVTADSKAEAPQESKDESTLYGATEVEADHRRNGDGSPEELQDVPVTMAATAESASRWTAVPVALEGEEGTISLDQEMQKAYAAFVATETDSAAAGSVREEQAATAEEFSTPAEAKAEASAAASSVPEHELVTEPQPAIAANAEPAQSEAEAFIEAAGPALVPVDVAPVEANAKTPGLELAEPIQHAMPVAEFMTPVSEAEVAGLAGLVGLGAQVQEPAPEAELPMAEAQTVASRAFAPIVRATEQIAEGVAEPAAEPKPDPETVKSTAAAWASWRQIRDTSKGSEVAQAPDTEFEVPQSAPAETARAVAAGAEQTVQEASAAASGSPTDVASIVDSVLADLRPKLMAEISRKMAEKK
ncbi:MAG TPA: response regulator [Candidatus Acidoferrum sp.]|nr:response regulator [Candidatus Acidoferrum sp.]